MKRLLCMLITAIMLLGPMQVLVFAESRNDDGPVADRQKEQPETPIEPQDPNMPAMATDYLDWSYEFAGINEYGIDINNNRLFDYLRVDLILNVLADGILNIQGTLFTEDMDMQLGHIEANPALTTGLQTIVLDFNGVDINRSQVNGPYMIDIAISDGILTENILFRSKAYGYTQFESYITEMPPVLEPIGNKTVRENETLQFTLSANDPNGDAITYSAENLPAGAGFDPESGLFTWTPDYTQAGVYSEITFIASDGVLTDSETIEIVVENVNRAPVLDHINDIEVKENHDVKICLSAYDPDGDPLTCSVSNAPEGAIFDTVTNEFSWTPGFTQAGSYTVSFIVSDGSLLDQTDVSITIHDVKPGELLATLKEYFKSLGLNKYVEAVLLAILDAAEKFLNKGNYDTALAQLKAFIAAVKTFDIKNYLIKLAEEIIDAIEQIKNKL